MRIRFFAASFIVVLAHTMATAAPPPPPMIPSAPWNVEFADSMCLLSRPYGKDGATTLFLKPAMLGTSLEIIISRSEVSNGTFKFGRAGLAIAGKKLNSYAGFHAYSTANARLVRILTPDKISLSGIRDTLTVDVGEDGHHTFTLAGIERAIPVLDACIAQLRVFYKVSEAEIGALASEPEVVSAGIFTLADIPRDALKSGQLGTVGVLIWVETNGHVSKCDIIESNAPPSLEQKTCKIMLDRARFTPAKNAARNAVRAPIFARIPWRFVR